MDHTRGTKRRHWFRRMLGRRTKPRPSDEQISERTLRMFDQAAENFRQGIVGPPVDLERLRRLAS